MRSKERTKYFRMNGDTVMSTKEELIREIEKTPTPLLSEVLDFIHFLRAKAIQDKMDIAVMSESSLGEDWLNPEEDEAWKNLKS